MEIGISYSEFWDMTPHEINLYATAKQDSILEAFKRDIQVAYYGAYFHNSKRPNLNKVLSEIDKNKSKSIKNRKEMSDEDMLKMAQSLNTIFGGKVK